MAPDPFDPFDPRLTWEPQAVFAQHRERHRISEGESAFASGQPAIFLLGFDDCSNELAAPHVLNASSVGRRLDVNEAFRPLAHLASDFLGGTDPPEHTAQRRLLLQTAFTPQRIELLRPKVVEVALELVSAIRAKPDRFEFISDFAFPLPMIIIGELLGIPRNDCARLGSDSATFMVAQANPRDPDLSREGQQAARSMVAYFEDLIDRRRSEPGSDLLSALIEDDKAGTSPFSRGQLLAVAIELLIAGHETTVSALARGFLGLLSDRATWEALCASPDELIPTAVEELLRWTSPLQRLRSRYAREECVVAGRAVGRGDEISLLIGSANHDPDKFPAPDVIDLTRDASRHLAFGRGRHMCIGAPLARMEFAIALRTLVGAFPRLRLDPDTTIVWRNNPLIPRPEALWMIR